MRTFNRAAITVLLSLFPHFALSQSADADLSGDLGAMRARAAADPQLAQRFEQVVAMAQRDKQRSVSRDLFHYVFQDGRWFAQGLAEPVRIDTVESLDPARRRATVVSRILVADLNGDWEITRDELMEVLKFAPNEAAAEAFMLADKDRNDILSTDEIRAAVPQLAERGGIAGGQDRVNLMRVFDFDGDGMLAPEELDRGMKAIAG